MSWLLKPKRLSTAWSGKARRPPARAYSPECVEGKFSELRLEGVLRGSSQEGDGREEGGPEPPFSGEA